MDFFYFKMVKKKNQGKKRSKAKPSTVITKAKGIFFGACFCVVAIAASLFTYQTISPFWDKYVADDNIEQVELPATTEKKANQSQKKEQNTTPKTSQKSNSKSEKNSTNNSTKLKEFPANAELPVCQKKVTEQIITHTGYTVSYNSDYRIANWVAYELTSQEVQTEKAQREDKKNKFVSDPMVEGATAENSDYTRTGYDRGHLAPAADMKWSYKAMLESFYLSNITPQKPQLNRGIWKELEEQCRQWAVEKGSLLIATGPVITPDLKRLGKNRVAIPQQFYKVICTIEGNRCEAVGFLFENRDYGSTQLKDMMIPVDEVEKVTGIDFFPALPDAIENEAEAVVHKNVWSY